MEQGDLKKQIYQLVKLQELDKQIYALKEEKEEKPRQIQILEETFGQKKNKLQEIEKDIQSLLKEKKDKELELASKEEQIKKLQAQLYQLKTNKEYAAMLKEIENIKADVSLQEDKILIVMEKIEQRQKDIEIAKKDLLKEEAAFNAQKNEIQKRIKEIEEQILSLEEKRKQLCFNIQPFLLSQYERILKNRDGLAIVKVINGACEGCNMRLPPQMINLIKMYERIINCEVCQRMLYLEEDLDEKS